MSGVTVTMMVRVDVEGLKLKLSSEGRSIGSVDLEAEAETLFGRPLTEEERADLVARLKSTNWADAARRVQEQGLPQHEGRVEPGGGVSSLAVEVSTLRRPGVGSD